MCNPYDNNPFRTDDRRDFTNEYDANRALANPTDKDFDERNYTDGAWWLEREADQREKEELNCGACTVAIGAHHRRKGCRYYEGK